MPKDTAFKRMSKAEQAEYLRKMPKPPPMPRARSVAQGAPRAGAKPAREPEPRDGLEWLLKKKRLDAAQAREAMRIRLGFRDPDDGGVVGLRSTMEIGAGGGGGAGGFGIQTAIAAMSDARRDYLLIIGSVLWHDPQLVAVIDGVCGRGYTLRYLAGGDRHRADELETMLKVALSLVVAWRKRHERPLTNGAETAEQSVIPQSCA